MLCIVQSLHRAERKTATIKQTVSIWRDSIRLLQPVYPM
jgi:hypothetical protein